MSAPMPSRGNLVAECVRVMRLRIAAGEWTQLLPGERRLAETLQVGRDTIRLAVVQLEREGLLAAAGAGSRRRIMAAAEVAAVPRSRPLRIGLLAHQRLEKLPQPMLLEIDRIRDALADKDGSLQVIAPSWYEQRNPVKRLEALVEEEPCSAWMLLRSSAAVQGWFMKSRIPCLIRGYPHPGIELPHLDVDWHATARHAAGQLWRMGHRRVVVLSPAEPLKGVEAAVRGATELGEPDFEATVLVENGSSGGVARVLARALHFKQPPTAILKGLLLAHPTVQERLQSTDTTCSRRHSKETHKVSTLSHSLDSASRESNRRCNQSHRSCCCRHLASAFDTELTVWLQRDQRL